MAGLLTSPYHRQLYLSFAFFIIPYLYSYVHHQDREQSYTVEAAVVQAWNKIIQQPAIMFRRVVLGINCNVDIIIPGTFLLDRLNVTPPTKGVDHMQLSTVDDLNEAFTHYFERGAAVERYLTDQLVFHKTLTVAESFQGRGLQFHIGGNAALMAQKIASSFTRTTPILVGPIGPRSNELLHPSILVTNSTRISKDELHIIMEYKQGEVWGEYVTPASSRFIYSHDRYSVSAIVIDMFFNTVAQHKPDLVILSGLHILEFQPKEMRMEKLRMIKRNLLQINTNIPVHLELGSINDAPYAKDVLHRIIPYVDSLSLNEQELAFLSNVANGPIISDYPVRAGTLHVHKVVEMLHWLITEFGYDKSGLHPKKSGYRLQRIHFHCFTYQIMISQGTDWSNLAAALAAGARVAGRQACNIQNQVDTDMLELRHTHSLLLDQKVGKVYEFQPHSPLVSWMRGDAVVIYTPVLVCRFPTKTVGLDDAISAMALMYSQFFRMTTHTLREI